MGCLLAALMVAPCWAPVLAQMAFNVPKSKRHGGTTPVQLTDKDTVMLADFENRTGDAIFDDALQQALVIELGQSPFLNLLPDRKLKDALRAAGRQSSERITPDISQQLCAQTGSKAVLAGAIAALDDHYALELSAVGCGTGVTLAEVHGEAPGKESVLKILSQASAGLRLKLGESLPSINAFNVPIETLTNSLEALKNYSIGTSMQREKGDVPSIPFLKRAIEFDPDFPLPYAMLTTIYSNLRQPSLALECATRAYRLRDRTTDREQLRISAAYYFAVGELEKEIETYGVWKAKYPRDSLAHNNLGNAYANMGQLEKALAEYESAVHLTPTVAAYANIMGIQLSLNQLREARVTFNEAFTQKLDGRYVRQTLYLLAFLERDAKEMDQQMVWARGKLGDEDPMLSLQSDTEAYFGRLTNARNFTQRAISSALSADSKETAALWQVNAALPEAELGDTASAQQGVASALALYPGRDVKVVAALTLARTSDNVGAKALVGELEKNYPGDALMKLYWLPAINAAVELNQGHYSQALADLETARPYELGTAGTFINYLYPVYLRGEAYLLARNASAGAAEFQKFMDHSGIILNFVTAAIAQLELGRAYAMAHNIAKAKTAYRNFFALWRDADSDIPVLKQAMAEYAKLR